MTHTKMIATPPIPTDYSDVLLKIAQVLDLTPAQYERAIAHYQAVGKWLGTDGSPLAIYQPVIHPQGSLRYGTVIKPLSDEEEYDLDLVCRLLIDKRLTNQQQVKAMVGNRLKAHGAYERMLDEEGRRCWRLNYNEVERFHLDILPAIPDDFVWLLQAGVPYHLAQHALCITDKKTWGIGIEWPRSNPEGYARWFQSRMQAIFEQERQKLAVEMRLKVEDVPEYRIKTVLQRVVQILKRHRDIIFQDDDEKPISIIITTLAARAYQNEPNLMDALKQVLNTMADLVTIENGRYTVCNPVNPLENFADRWVDTPRKAEKFFEWVKQARRDFYELEQSRGLPLMAPKLKTQFGESIVNRALNVLGDETRQLRESGKLAIQRNTGLLTTSVSTGIIIPQHTFHGYH